jgi:hypothetical protein
LQGHHHVTLTSPAPAAAFFYVVLTGEIVYNQGELQGAGMADVLDIPRPRMTVIKFTVTETGGDSGWLGIESLGIVGWMWLKGLLARV